MAGDRGGPGGRGAFWPRCLPWPSPSPHTPWALMPCDPGGEQYLCLRSTLPTPSVARRLSSGLGWVLGLNTNLATSHYPIHHDCKADPDPMGNYVGGSWAKGNSVTPSLFVSLFPRLRARLWKPDRETSSKMADPSRMGVDFISVFDASTESPF